MPPKGALLPQETPEPVEPVGGWSAAGRLCGGAGGAPFISGRGLEVCANLTAAAAATAAAVASALLRPEALPPLRAGEPQAPRLRFAGGARGRRRCTPAQDAVGAAGELEACRPGRGSLVAAEALLKLPETPVAGRRGLRLG